MSIAVMEARPPIIAFEERAVEDRDASAKAGGLMMKSEDIVVIRQAGSANTVEKNAAEWLDDCDRRVQRSAMPASWAKGFRDHYNEWKAGRDAPVNGFPIREWASISKAMAENCINAGIFAVEDLAVANEELLGRIGMGSRALKDKAVAWLDSRKGNSSEELAALRAENKTLADSITELRAQIAELSAGQKKRA